MCQAKAEGGRRCFGHAMDLNAEDLKKKRAAAKKKGDKDAEREALRDYLTTEEGIEELEVAGKDDLAAKFTARRNRLIDEYNVRFNATKPHFASTAVRRAARKKTQPVWDARGFDCRAGSKHFHRDTGTVWNPEGWSYTGQHLEGGRFNPKTGLDFEGYDADGFLPATGLNRAGYDRSGYHFARHTNRSGYTRPDAQGHSYGHDGFDREGFHWSGFHGSQNGLHRLTGTLVNEHGQTWEQWVQAQGPGFKPYTLTAWLGANSDMLAAYDPKAI